MTPEEQQAVKMNQLIAKCWADERFKGRLLADPEGTMKEEGLAVPAGLTVKALENTDKIFHLVIPARPTELSADELDKVVGGILQGVQNKALVSPIQQWALLNLKMDY
jgi:hypothetical protein